MNNVNDVIELLRDIRGVFVTFGNWDLAVKEIDKAIALLEGMGGDAVNKLKGKADTAYCRYIDRMKSQECLGVDHKLSNGAFSRSNLEAWCEAREYLGHHQAFVEAQNIVSAHPPTQTAAVPEGWYEKIIDEMDRRFGLRSDHDDCLQIDDTQVGVEFALDQIEQMLNTTPPAQAARVPKAPTDSGIPELDGFCSEYNAGKRGLASLVCAVWNTAVNVDPAPVEKIFKPLPEDEADAVSPFLPPYDDGDDAAPVDDSGYLSVVDMDNLGDDESLIVHLSNGTAAVITGEQLGQLDIDPAPVEKKRVPEWFMEKMDQHALPAGECPPGCKVVPLYSIKRLNAAPVEKVDHNCSACGGDGYYKGPRLGDEPCPSCKGWGVAPAAPGDGDNRMTIMRASKIEGCPDSIPFSMLSERQAQINHSQSLARLNHRGGVSPHEALALHREIEMTAQLSQPVSEVVNALNLALQEGKDNG